MTALAMIIGMIPMALGLGDGGEENAPLGRAVIGGLLCATVATLVFVPTVFALLHGKSGNPRSRGNGESQCQKLNTSEKAASRLALLLGLAAAVALGLFIYSGIHGRVEAASTLQHATEQAAIEDVIVVCSESGRAHR